MKGKKCFLPQWVCIRAAAPHCSLEPWQQLDNCWGWFEVRVWSKMLYLHQATHCSSVQILQLAGKRGCRGEWNGDLVKPTVSTVTNRHRAEFVVFVVLQKSHLLLKGKLDLAGCCQWLAYWSRRGQWEPCQSFFFFAVRMNTVKLRGEAKSACWQEAAAQLHPNDLSPGCASSGRPTSPWTEAWINPTQQLAFVGGA